jgi:hypothetical protein
MTLQETTAFEVLLLRFHDAMQAWDYSPRTIEKYDRNVRRLICWFSEETDVELITEATRETLAGYQIELMTARTAAPAVHTPRP